MCGRNSGSDIFFYENGDLEKVANKVGIPKVASFSLGLGTKPYHVVCYVPGILQISISMNKNVFNLFLGKQGQPGNGRLFQYPKFEAGQAIASKSFFQVCLNN